MMNKAVAVEKIVLEAEPGPSARTDAFIILIGFDFVCDVEDASRGEFDGGKHAGQISARVDSYQAVAQPDLFTFAEDHSCDGMAENDRLAAIFGEKSAVARPIK